MLVCWRKEQAMSFFFEGMVLDAKSGQPLAGAKVYLAGSQATLGDVPGAVATGKAFSWTKLLPGSAVGAPPNNYRYAAYAALVQPTISVAELTFPTFRDLVLDRNPELAADGNLFQPNKVYLLPTKENGPEFVLEAETNEAGAFSFSGLSQSGAYGFEAEKEGYQNYFASSSVFDSMITQPQASIELSLRLTKLPPAAPALRINSTEPNFASLPAAVQKFVQCALLLITDNEAKAYDYLPQLAPQLVGMPYGAVNNKFDKDFVCADLPSICYAYAFGHAPNWRSLNPEDGNPQNPHQANFYLPGGQNGDHLATIGGPVSSDGNLRGDDWKLGDLILYGQTAGGRATHVNVYVGTFFGTDLDNKQQDRRTIPSVVNSSMNVGDDSISRGILVFDLLGAARPQFAGRWAQHVRISDLWR